MQNAEAPPTHLTYDRFPNESWDQYVVRKLAEEREYYAGRSRVYNCSTAIELRNSAQNNRKHRDSIG